MTGVGERANLGVVRPTVLIVDDHEAFRDAARALLDAQGFDVVGVACDALTALDAVELLRPEVVLLDIQLPDLDGFEVAARLARRVDPPIVVLISSRDARTYGVRVDESPTRGFLAKRDLTGGTLADLLA